MSSSWTRLLKEMACRPLMEFMSKQEEEARKRSQTVLRQNNVTNGDSKGDDKSKDEERLLPRK